MALNCVLESPIDFPGGKIGQNLTKNSHKLGEKRGISTVRSHQRLFVCYESLFFLCPIFIEYYSCLVRCLHFIKWLPTAGACPDQVEHVIVGPHVSLLVEEIVTPKWTVLWLSQLFDSFNVLQCCPACYSKLETWWILLLFYWRSNMFLSQDTSRHCSYGNFGDKNHRFCLPAKQWGVR